MAISKRNIIDDIVRIATRFGFTDDSRLKLKWVSYKIDQIREQLILKDYIQTNRIDRNWFSNLGKIALQKVNMADDASITFCCDTVSKTTLPQIISLTDINSGNLDLGLTTVMSVCGTQKYFLKSLSLWKDIPSEHTYSLFNFYDRVGPVFYCNKVVDFLYFPQALLFDYTDGVIRQSDPIVSGTIATGTVYVVRYGSVIYNGNTYTNGQTFTGVAGKTTFLASGKGQVFLQNNERAVTEDDPYPISGTMGRDIVLEILTKEFGLEAQQINDEMNDSKDDQSQQGQAPAK